MKKSEYIGLERAARRKIDYYTYNRVKELEEVPNEVKECIIDLVQYISSLEGIHGKEIERERTDTYEVQYSTPGKGITGKDLKEYKIKGIIKEYLSHTGLLNRGIYRESPLI